MGKNRDRLGIFAAILEAAYFEDLDSDSSKSRIMSLANLSFSLMEKYLDYVVRAGFVEVKNSRYKTTERGKEFLKQYKQFHVRYVSAQRLLESLEHEREHLSRLCKSSKLVSSRQEI